MRQHAAPIGFSVLIFVLAVGVVGVNAFDGARGTKVRRVGATDSNRLSVSARNVISRTSGFGSNVDGGPRPSSPGEVLTPIETAYIDAWSILSERNSCSQFFGPGAIGVLDRFVEEMREESLNNASIGIQMSGEYANVTDHSTGSESRMFEESTLNTNGPFFRQYDPETRINFAVGSFVGGTREARVLMLMHEIGHLIRTRKDQWLLPNDGEDAALSMRNTRTIERSCGDQIRGLRKNDRIFLGLSGPIVPKPGKTVDSIL